MSETVENRNFESLADNGAFYLDFLRNLKEQTTDIKNLRVLDYGAGTETPKSLFGHIKDDQEKVVAYDPYADVEKFNQTVNNPFHARWADENMLLGGENFDLVVCNFSMHHIGKNPDEIEEGVKKLGELAPIIAIADYDYRGKDPEEFTDTFKSEQERKELQNMFRGDMQQCFEYHSRLGIEDYIKALEDSGYTVVKKGKGEGVARDKFYVIGQKLPLAEAA